jgi:hypothetical protein
MNAAWPKSDTIRPNQTPKQRKENKRKPLTVKPIFRLPKFDKSTVRTLSNVFQKDIAPIIDHLAVDNDADGEPAAIGGPEPGHGPPSAP